MRLLAEDLQLVLQQFDVDVLLLNGHLVHDFDCERFLTIFVHAEFDCAKCALSERLAKEISIVNVLQFLKLLEIAHMQRLLAI